jgi:ketosteroid isomerase-like protein
MSRENLELVRNVFAEFERGNFWVGDIFDPNVRIVWLDALAGGEKESVGLESLAATVREWLRTWDRMTMTAERITDVGDQVLVIATWRGRGITSAAPAEWRHGQVWTIRDGKVTSLVSSSDPADAIEAVGLSE